MKLTAAEKRALKLIADPEVCVFWPRGTKSFEWADDHREGRISKAVIDRLFDKGLIDASGWGTTITVVRG